MPNPLANIGDLTKPATVLIEKISDAVGVLYEPRHVIHIAKAEAEVEKIRAESEIAVKDIHQRAIHRFFKEEAIKQGNIEGIIQKALPNLNADAKSDNIENDWIANFFDKCRLISDQEMQGLWSKVLSGEANTPDTFSKRTVNFLSDLDKSDAELFTQLCGFGWQIGSVVPIVYDNKDEIYTKNGVDFETLSHLKSIGLIQFDIGINFSRLRLPKSFTTFYYGQPVECEMRKDADNSLDYGHVMLTKIGKELTSICGSQPVDGFMEYVLDKWRSKNYLKKEVSKP